MVTKSPSPLLTSSCQIMSVMSCLSLPHEASKDWPSVCNYNNYTRLGKFLVQIFLGPRKTHLTGPNCSEHGKTNRSELSMIKCNEWMVVTRERNKSRKSQQTDQGDLLCLYNLIVTYMFLITLYTLLVIIFYIDMRNDEEVLPDWTNDLFARVETKFIDLFPYVS